MPPDFVKILVENGIGVGLTIIISAMFFFVLKHILTQQDKIMDMAINQNSAWQKVIEEHSAQAREFHTIAVEAFRYMRDEHKEMNECQISISQTLEENNVILSGFQRHCERVQEDCRKHQEKVLDKIEAKRI